MSKKNFVSLILGTVGGILFALGMCMAMIPEWNAFTQGVIIGCVGAVILLIMLLVRRKMEGKPIIVKLSGILRPAPGRSIRWSARKPLPRQSGLWQSA